MAESFLFHRGSLVAGFLIAVAFAFDMPAALGVTIGAPTQSGIVTAASLPEISGIVDSRANADTFWVHNDKGDSARFFAINHAGDLLGAFPLSGAAAGDWEDVAIGPKPGGGNYLYLGDIGDNDSNRAFITIHRTDEPQSTAGATIAANAYASAILLYPNGSRNAESLFVDPLSSEMFIVTKGTTSEIYSVPTTAFDTPGQTTTLTALGTLGAPLRTATAADISPDGRHILVRSSKSSTGYLFERGVGQSVAEALHGSGIPFALAAEVQGEAIAWAADGASFYTVSERDGLPSVPIFSYAFSAPASIELPGDYNNDHVVDAADYTVWRNQLGSEIALPNETETPGNVTVEDFNVWRSHFGDSQATAVGTAARSIPEPGTWLLTLLTMLGFGLAAPLRR